ncbi:serine/threonine kinase [Aureococcus anophagefferens]|nr:serine/threonine kinase [Aureococcus anophagefferens]
MAAMTDPTQRLAAALRACARRVPTRLHLTAAERRTLCVAAAAGAAFAVAYRGAAAALDALTRRAAADDDGDDASSASGDEAGARLSLVYDVAVGDRVVADVPHKTCHRAPLVEGRDDVVLGDKVTDAASGGSGVVVGLAPGDGEVWVSDGRRRFKAQAKHLAHAPLAGGLAKGDQVVACAGFERVEVGDPGAVVGPCSSPNLDAFESRVLVDFGAKGRYSYTRAARAALAHAPLVPADVRKNDVIRAKVDYEDVRAGDLGVNNWQPGNVELAAPR